MFFDEEMLLDLRLNVMNRYVDKFVITEATYMHNGKPKKLNFNIKKFEKFKDKIIYVIDDQIYSQTEEIKPLDNEGEKSRKYIFNATYRENGQRNLISKGLGGAENEDLILISDVDEINTDWFNGINSVGICGATSTPRWLMENVQDTIENIT